MAGTPYLLLEATIDGRAFRWSTTRIVIDGTVYEAGLLDTTVELGTESVAVGVVDPSVDWPALAPEADGGSAVLRRWLTGQALVDALPLCSGELRVGSWGARDDPFAATIYRTTGPSLGTQVPDVTASIVAGDTWPLPGSAGVEVAQPGVSYPVIFGYPGYQGDPSLPVLAVVPIPVGQQSDGTLGRPLGSTTVPVVCEDGTLAITSVHVYNSGGASSIEDVVFQADGRLHGIRIVQFANDAPSWPDPADGVPNLWAGFTPSGGGGPRTAYEVLTYGLRRWGIDSADWARLPEVADLLERFLVDDSIVAPESSFWGWFRSALMPFLPVEIRSSERGLYLVEQRYRSDPRRVIGTLDIDSGQGALTGPVTLSDTGPYSEFVANYRPDRDGGWRGQVLLTGRAGVESSQTIGAAGILELSTTGVFSSLCSRSSAKYGPRPSTPLDLDWTWDEGTASAVLSWTAERDALPARIVSYDVSTSGLDPREGDELLLTDTARGFVGVPAIVTTPPVYSATTTSVDLRIPPTG